VITASPNDSVTLADPHPLAQRDDLDETLNLVVPVGAVISTEIEDKPIPVNLGEDSDLVLCSLALLSLDPVDRVSR
jgi:hypothetical protein